MTNVKVEGTARKRTKSKKSSVLRRLKYKRIFGTACLAAVIGFGVNMVASASKDMNSNKVEAAATAPVKVQSTEEYKPTILSSGSVRCMVYTGGGVTATGVEPYVGCIAGSRDLLGKSCYLYTSGENGEKGGFIGKFKFDDTGYGVDGNIANGEAVCVYRCDEESCNTWIADYGDNVYMEVFYDK